MTDIITELVRPVSERLTKMQWLGVSIVIGFFLGFFATLIIAALIGYVLSGLPSYFGIPTTFIGYFLAGYVLSAIAPKEIVWEIPTGILVCSLVFLAGFVGFTGQGALMLLVTYVLLPAIAVGVCYLGLILGREGWAGVKSLIRRTNDNSLPAEG